MDIIQFRLTNHDEIICEVVEEADESGHNMVIRNAMLVITHDNPAKSQRVYSFRPWMVYQDQKDYFQLLNISHIVGEAKPDAILADQYYRALDNEHELSSNRQEQIEERLEEITRKILEYAKANDLDIDSDLDAMDNVIRFDRNKMH